MLRSLAASAALLGSAHAFWRMECPGRVGLARMDPITNSGSISPHVHAIHGSSGFTLTSSFDELAGGDCTSCRVTQDKSVYWHPALYFQDADTGEYELVKQVGGMLAYYLLNGDNITAFPPGFRMLSGDTDRRTYTAGDPSLPDTEKSLWAANNETGQDTLAQRSIGFNCLNYAMQPEATLYRHYLPDKAYLDANCKDGIRFEVMFPSCWNGIDLDTENHMAHVAFPDLVITGQCPEDFPVRTPSLLYETIWATNAYADRNGHFIIANNDVTGYGYHGDFVTGWDEDFLQQAVDTCTNPSGRIEDCPIFDVVDEATAKSCEITVPDELADEDVVGPVAKMPGGDEGSPEGGDAEPTNAPQPTLSYVPGQIPENPASPLPGDVFLETSAYVAPAPTTLNTVSVPPAPSTSAEAVAAAVVEAPVEEPPAPAPTTTPAPEVIPAEDSARYFSTQYITNGNVVSKILWYEERVTVTAVLDSTTTIVVPEAPTDSPQRKRRAAHLHGHGHGHHHI
ncbi:hypothetical protein S7711_08689 [Stachybotrys chartarum IBT 7711]|uniref:DUF1996 domain-containing protein n=1 Tax=Stachybotrys chartarum (strain CBS 109288 / IBT 7711) TaxID=1280523 RepID=A0A084AF85_STACB|nr:hypothetical protein S7711_08689 [Stachybotrys chartarum IBT 7711]KFA46514.1 hypothetical protein S40293_04258 [Stachybotrys chartarum IBT 40293]